MKTTSSRKAAGNVPSGSRATSQGPSRVCMRVGGSWALVLPKLSTLGSVVAVVLGHLVGPVHPPWSLTMSCFTKRGRSAHHPEVPGQTPSKIGGNP